MGTRSYSPQFPPISPSPETRQETFHSLQTYAPCGIQTLFSTNSTSRGNTQTNQTPKQILLPTHMPIITLTQLPTAQIAQTVLQNSSSESSEPHHFGPCHPDNSTPVPLKHTIESSNV